MIESFQIGILIVLLLFLLNLLQNLKMIQEKKSITSNTESPLVSILVPARNEERNIKTCLSSLLKQDYLNLEIIVLDDNSSDRTYEIARETARGSTLTRIVRGKELPADWHGKNWACHQLSRLAAGKWFLFTDADTVHSTHAVSQAIASAQKNHSQFVTTVPGLITKTWSEKLYLPILHFAFLALLPFYFINYSRTARIPFGVGPFMLVERDAYFYSGGYNVIRKRLVDDMALSKIIKNSGGKITVIDGTDLVRVRFYRNFKELWKGFTKNHYEAIWNAPLCLVGLLLFSYFIFIYPYLSLWGAMQDQQSITVPLMQILILSVMKLILSLRFNTSIFFGQLIPFQITLCVLLFLNSFRITIFKKKMEWKERFYPVGR